MKDDTVAWPMMLLLARNIEEELARCELPALCRCNPVPGPSAVVDAVENMADKCSGMGWVRHVTEYPSEQFPEPSLRASDCNDTPAFQLEVGIARKVNVGQVSRLRGVVAPSGDELTEQTRIQMADKSALRRAIIRTAEDRALSLGAYVAMQVTGDTNGGFWTPTFWMV